MNWLERTIEAFSPRWAAERAYYRSIVEHARGYDAAKTGRRTAGWSATGTSANAEIGPAAARIRARARDLVRNNPHAARGARVTVGNLVGAGIVPRLDTDDRAAKLAARDDWRAFSDNCDPEGLTDFYGMQALVARTVFESGEALIQLLPQPSTRNLRVPLQLQVLEPDYLDWGKTGETASGGVIIQGVEFDRSGRRVAYWLFDQHPGETAPMIRRKYASVRVPASRILPVFDRLRPGQIHGVPWLAPAVMKLRDIADYDEAELVRKKIEACFAAFVKRSGTATSPLAKDSTTDASGRRIERLSPGMVQYLALDEDVTFAAPEASEGYAEYMKVQLHAVAAGIGCTYEQLTGDLEKVNYSSIREGKVEYWQLLDVWQWHMMIPQACRPVWSAFQVARAAAGRVPEGGLGPAIWAPPKRAWVDPAKDVKAQVDAIRGGLLTLRDAIAARGEDPDEQLDEIEATLKELDAKGIVLDSDARRGKGAAPARPASQEQEDENA